MKIQKKKKKMIFVAGAGILLLATALLSLCWGSYEISIPEVVQTLIGKGTDLQRTAIFSIRLPRILVGMLVAAALAVSGGILQTMTKNDLADPGIIGINAGGAVAAVIFIQLQTATYYSELGTASIYVLPFLAICGALLAAAFIYFLSARKGLRPKRMLLMGIGVNAGLNAFITFFTFRGGPGEYNKVLIWTTGSLWGAGWSYFKVLLPIIVVLLSYVFWKGRTMDAMNFTDETAIGWGVSVEKERKKMLLAAVILAGAATAFAGNIGFLGLTAPHIARKITGYHHRRFLSMAAVIASVMLLLADAVSRNLFSPIEIPAGITVSIIGVPYFVYLMIKEEK
ncbi:MAG: FecCD family ABC transporter permease [Roseburia sp.]